MWRVAPHDSGEACPGDEPRSIGVKRARRYETVRKIATTIAIAVLASGIASTKAEAVTRMPHKCRAVPASTLCAIHFHHHRVNVYRSKMGLKGVPYGWVAESHPGRRTQILVYWTKAQKRAEKRYVAWKRTQHSPLAWYHSSGAQCVHNGEGPWTANTGNGYYGGFQMDMAFQRAHGARYLARYGTANHWPAIDQIRVTRSVVKSSGWGQWPNTARVCGLL